MTVKYRLLRSIVGVYKDQADPIMIPAGAILEISPTSSTTGIVTASYKGRVIWVFMHDLLNAGRIEPTGNVE